MNHHYIPQFYLRPWLGVDHKLQEFRRGYRDRIEIGRYGTKVTGCAEDLYTLPGVTEETKQNVERFFMSFVDDAAVKARDQMLQRELPVDPETRHSWARFLISLVFRNPEEVLRFKTSHRQNLLAPDPEFQRRYEAHRQEGDPALFEDWMVQTDPTYLERESVLMLTRLMENAKVLRLIRGMHWRIIDTSTVSRRLMTSDRPVVMTNGFGRYDGHIGIPISPTKLFIAFSVNDYANAFCQQPVGKIVRLVNQDAIGQGRKYVYALDGTASAQVRREMGRREPPSFVQDFIRPPKSI